MIICNFKLFLENREQYSQVSQILDSTDFVFYFKKDGSIFGAPEESRITFARMIHPDEEDGKDWVKDASFTAVCLDDLLSGKLTQRIFSKKDLKTIKVIDKETVAEELGKKS